MGDEIDQSIEDDPQTERRSKSPILGESQENNDRKSKKKNKKKKKKKEKKSKTKLGVPMVPASEDRAESPILIIDSQQHSIIENGTMEQI